MRFKPTVLVVAREHSFRIEDKGRKCRFQQSERFSGVLVPLFGAGIFEATQRGFARRLQGHRCRARRRTCNGTGAQGRDPSPA
jgi:hypothetical protein